MIELTPKTESLILNKDWPANSNKPTHFLTPLVIDRSRQYRLFPHPYLPELVLTAEESMLLVNLFDNGHQHISEVIRTENHSWSEIRIATRHLYHAILPEAKGDEVKVLERINHIVTYWRYENWVEYIAIRSGASTG